MKYLNSVETEQIGGSLYLNILLSEYAGFCFGVKKAVSTAFKLANSKDRIFTYGPIIHNSSIVKELEQKGVRQLGSIDELRKGDTVIIRSHGVSKAIMDSLNEKDVNIVDATCTYVENIHKRVEENYKKGYKIIIIGDRNHPEVQGINGWCDNTAEIIKSEDEAKCLKPYPKVCIVSQTTMDIDRWKAIVSSLICISREALVFNTICKATELRQKAAKELSKKSDAVIVLGGYDSSNTQKLVDICKKNCPKTYHVENINELDMRELKGVNTLGITAGASTPDRIIKEAIDKMNDNLNTQDENSGVDSMMDEYEKTLIRLHPGDIVKGRIIYVTDEEATVDLGYKADGIITKQELSFDGNVSPKDMLKPDDEIDVYVLKVNDGEGNVLLSKKKADAEKSIDYIEECFKNKTLVDARVSNIVKGGAIAEVKGVNVFIPASQIDVRYVEDLSTFSGKTLKILITAFEPERRRIVGSRRVVLAKEAEAKKKELLERIQPGDKLEGTVCRITDFGAFVDLGGIDGLIHISELSWTRIKHPSEVVKEGDKVEVYVISVDKDKERISLSLKRTVPEPWENIGDRVHEGDLIEGKVVRIAPFGAFVQVEPGVDGLVHISQISQNRINKVEDVLKTGDTVKVKVLGVDPENKKISLSIKEAVEEENKAENESYATEAKDDNVTISEIVSNKDEDNKTN